jgi:hypothetical protein
VHSLLVISPLGEDKTGFISTHPHGRPITQRFKGAADELKRYAPGPFDIGGRPGPSDFYFSFSGINASPKEVVAAFYREWKKQAK